MSDTPAATAPRRRAPQIDTATAVGLLVGGALVALAGLRVGFSGSVATSIGK